jgi:hypothetical protein
LWSADDRKAFVNANPKFATGDKVTFPILISSQRLISTEEGKKITTDGIQATVPVAQASSVQLLLDGTPSTNELGSPTSFLLVSAVKTRSCTIVSSMFTPNLCISTARFSC